MSFGEVEAMFKDWYGSDKINRGNLENNYELAREDILFWQEQKEKKTTRVLTK